MTLKEGIEKELGTREFDEKKRIALDQEIDRTEKFIGTLPEKSKNEAKESILSIVRYICS